MDGVTGVLCHLLRDSDDGAPGTALGSLSAEDWRRVALAAEGHGLGPLLHGRSRMASWATQVPDEIREAWRRSFLRNAARHAMLHRELGEILGRLQESGIPVIVLKGGCLAPTVYGHVAERPMNDLDLLVPPGRLADAARAVLQSGYAFQYPPVFSDALLASPGWSSEVVVHHESRLCKPPGSAVELHWNLAAPRSGIRVDLDALWHRSRPLALGTISARMLGREDLLLHLALHATRGHPDAWALGLRPLYDLAAVLRREAGSLDWGTLVARASAWRVSRGVGAALALAREMLQAPVPEACLEALGIGILPPGWRTVAFRRMTACGERGSSTAPDVLWVPEVGRLITRPGPGRWQSMVRRVFPGRTYWNETEAARQGVPYSWQAHGRHVGTKVRQLARLIGHALRHPGRTVEGLRAAREEARFNEWLREEGR